MTSSIAERTAPNRKGFLIPAGFLTTAFILLICVVRLQQYLDYRIDQSVARIEELVQLPRGEYLKPAMLGYNHVGADMLWLRLIQVIGERRNTADQYEWMYHVLDVITTLDPQYSYAYYVGGVILGDLANRPDLSNHLLTNGVKANPTVWNLPFLLGYNYYFLMGDAGKAAEYIMRASGLPDAPSYLPGLATRMAAEGGKPETALLFLQARVRETNDPNERAFFVNRMKEVLIERDIRILEEAIATYLSRYQRLPMALGDLLKAGIIAVLPTEPFEGTYVLDQKSGAVTSSTHPERLHTFHKRNQSPILFPQVKPAYVFPKTW